MFSFETEEIRKAYEELFYALDGSEPCYDPDIANPDAPIHESPTDQYVENWTGKNMSKAAAEALCADCPVKDLCRNYAVLAEEPDGIWGGTRPIDRGITPKYKE